MTTLTTKPELAPLGGEQRRFSPGWMIFSAVVVVALVIDGVYSKTGVSGDPRLANPGGVRTAKPFLGVHNWPDAFSIGFVVIGAIMLVVIGRMCIRDRKLHRVAIVMMAVLVLSFIDPPANWVSYTIYDPRMIHFPTTWSWFRLSPTVEPSIVLPAYPMYYGLMGLLACWIYARGLAPRLSPSSWFRRHPLLTVYAVGMLVGFLWDLPTELFMLRARMYEYSESWGPTIHWGNAAYPLVWGFFTWSSIAATTVLLLPDDRGQLRLASAIANRFRTSRAKAAGRPSSGSQLAAGSVVLIASYLFCFALYGGMRIGHVVHPTTGTGGWQYNETKTYDPYGDLKKAGYPGPYYR
jgi:hypothetical protein